MNFGGEIAGLAQKRHRLGGPKEPQIVAERIRSDAKYKWGRCGSTQVMSHGSWIRTDHSGEIAVVRHSAGSFSWRGVGELICLLEARFL